MDESPFNLNQQNSNIDARIIASLERISQVFKFLLWNEGKKNGLTPIQIQVLLFLYYHSSDKCKVTYLANEFNITKATISDTIKTLEEKKLLFKNSESIDLRSYTIHLTEMGEEMAQKTAFFTNELQASIHNIPQEEKTNFLLNLIDIIQNLKVSGIINIQRMCFSCSYYQNDDEKHFCRLLNQQLASSNLRIDCPDYKVNDNNA